MLLWLLLGFAPSWETRWLSLCAFGCLGNVGVIINPAVVDALLRVMRVDIVKSLRSGC